jgi:hypothetical protein
MTDTFIELDRHFVAVASKSPDEDQTDIDPAFSHAMPVQWSDLLAKDRVIILAEPGAGKTWEIRHAAERLRRDGKTAFFLRLEHVAQNFTLAFDVGTHAEFLAWA